MRDLFVASDSTCGGKLAKFQFDLELSYVLVPRMDIKIVFTFYIFFFTCKF